MLLLPCNVRQGKSVQFYADRLYYLANDAFAKLDKAVVESQLAGFFIDGLYNDFLYIKVMTENSISFQAAVQSALAEQNSQKTFQLESTDHDNPKGRTEEPMEIDQIRPQRKFDIDFTFC